MYLSYLDESRSDSTKVKNPYFVLSAVLVHDKLFEGLEVKAAIVVESLIPEERRAQFTEFHGWELYGGYGIFDGIAPEERFRAIRILLGAVTEYKLPVVSAIVDLERLRLMPYASAEPYDLAFRKCIVAIQNIAFGVQPTAETGLLILDNTTDKRVKEAAKQSFRTFRPHLHEIGGFTLGPLWNLHDAMYFGDSRDALGLQLADLCSYFIRRNEEQAENAKDFYRIFEQQITHIDRLP